MKELYSLDKKLVEMLLHDCTSKNPIIWATSNYSELGDGFSFNDGMTYEKLENEIIKTRTEKSIAEKKLRTKEKAEVFTPSWICNNMNNLFDEQWFGNKPFNVEGEKSWKATNRVEFKDGKDWRDYVSLVVLEITCGEAPYLVSRYDAYTGNEIPLKQRVGLLDRKLRVICENVEDEKEWVEYAYNAYKATYGYEWQGDNLLVARVNLLTTFIEYFEWKFEKKPDDFYLEEICKIIQWNLWQMDGLKFVIPGSCSTAVKSKGLFASSSDIECTACQKNGKGKHKGVYCNIFDWEEGLIVKFEDIFQKQI